VHIVFFWIFVDRQISQRMSSQVQAVEVARRDLFFVGFGIMGNNPSSQKGENLPVETVSWNVVMEFCRKLTERERAAGRLLEGYEYTLPTEAQWEYACRGGTTTRFSYGDDLKYRELETYASYKGSSQNQTHDVGGKLSNPWGLHDMHGNVWEWCLDWWSNSYPGGSVANPKGPSSGEIRVVRGGGWNYTNWYCRSAHRTADAPDLAYSHNGFRVALVAVP
jgi:formylglycine-generating enzyme required for sulfatase activity